ncbi:hypothetical protein BH18ACI5_BH18ACI5_06870 [soil metagenome]
MDRTARIFRMTADGKDQTDIAPAGFAGTFSPDSRYLIALSDAIRNTFLITLLPSDGSPPTQAYDIFSFPWLVQLTPAGDALTFLESRRGPQSLWTQPLDGRPPRELLGMGGDRIFNFAWSRDNRVAVSHGPTPTDVVILTDVR